MINEIYQKIEEVTQKLQELSKEAAAAEVPFVADSAFLAFCSMNAVMAHFGNLRYFPEPEPGRARREGVLLNG
jgi:uncharacterized protein (DUF39 family)